MSLNIFFCVSMTPFAMPVVPDVKRIADKSDESGLEL